MNAATFLILLLSNGGNWLSGAENSVRAEWTLGPAERAALPAADLVWEIAVDRAKLAGGTLSLDPARGETTIHFVCPEVRARVTLRLNWRVVAKAGGKELASGAAAVEAYPADLTGGWAKFIGEKKLVVVDPEGKLSAILAAAKVPHMRLADTTKLALDHPDIVLVAPAGLDGSRFEQAPLLGLAKAGASVMLFRQTRPQRLGEYEIVRRGLPKRLVWDADQPLLRPFTPEDLAGWQTTFPAEAEAIRLPADEPALAACRWPSDAPAGRTPGAAAPPATPTDALLAVKREGEGRLVLCQIPLGDWATDPRSQLFLGAALDYLTTRPEPTPPPAGSSFPADPAAGRRAAIPIKPGDQP